ncbi:MAG: fused response regulator/phosphatase [Pseudomonadota bacterium]
MSDVAVSSRLLIVEPNVTEQAAIQAHLEDNGFAVQVCSTYAEARQVCQNIQPALVVLTLVEPLSEGIQWITDLHQQWQNLPILVSSTPEIVATGIRALRLGAWDYLLKPMTQLSVLEHAICKCLERARLEAENQRYKKEIEETNKRLKDSLDILEQDEAAGRSVQSRLFPKATWSIAGYEFMHCVRPSLYLSGDFTDYFEIGPDCYGFYMMDVSGHGASSAFVTVFMKSLIDRCRFGEHADLMTDPKKLLAFLGEELFQAKLGKYATMVYAVLTPSKNQVYYSVGGHYPHPIYWSGTEGRYLPDKSFPVGMLPKATYENREITLEPNAVFALCSDGVLELIPNLTVAQKELALLGYIKDNHESVEKLFDVLLSQQHQSSIPDDVTVLLLRRTPTV